MPGVRAQTFSTINPATGLQLAEYCYLGWHEASLVLQKAEKAYRRNLASDVLSDRQGWVRQVARDLTQQKDEIANLITLEMGKPLKESRSEVEKCVALCEHFAVQSAEWLKPEPVSDQYQIIRHPYGVVLGIMPWNYPFWQVFRFAVPAILSGNAVLLKHADQVAGCAGLLEKIFQNALGDRDLFHALIVDHQVAEKVIQDPVVRMVSFTGSTAAGEKIASLCGAVAKKCVLELGGNDPYVVTETADVKLASRLCASARLVNNGQSCVSAKRFLIHQSVWSEFLSGLQTEFSQYVVGDPTDKATDLGPLAAQRFVKQLQEQCLNLEALGYQKIYEHDFDGEISLDLRQQGSDCFFAPRIYVGSENSTFYDEEIFGPVAVCYIYRDWHEVLHFVTTSQYGLGSALFSQNPQQISQFIHFSEAGFIAINDMVRSSPVVPFGGFKSSGHGRELGVVGFHEFTQTKTVCKGKSAGSSGF